MAKNIKELKLKKADQAKRSDVRLYRLMVEFVLTILAVTGSVMLGNFNRTNQLGAHNFMFYAVLVSGVLFAVSAIFCAIGKKNSDDNAYKVITKGGIFGNLAVLFFGCAHFYLFYDAEKLIITLIAAALVYFTYNIFGGALVDFAVITAAGFITLIISAIPTGFIPKLGLVIVYGAKILAIAIPVAAVIYAVLKASKKKGRKTAVVPIVISSLITLAGGVLNFVYPAAAVYAVFGLAGWYLITVIAHTVKNV